MLSPSIAGYCVALLASHVAATSAPVRVPRAAATLAAPVLNAAMNLHGSEDEHTIAALENALARIFRQNNRASDEALAVLIEFYVGEHSGEEISCELVHRGKRVLRSLAKYHGRRIIVPGVDMSRTEPNDALYAGVQKEIREGKSCEREP